MNKVDWIKDLVMAERKIEETGMFDMSIGLDEDHLCKETIKFLLDIKSQFVDSASVFNQMRGLSIGGVKIYGIAKTEADFMLFRNGYKLHFSMKNPGVISIRFAYQGASIMPGTTNKKNPQLKDSTNEDTLEAKWMCFGELQWMHKNHPVNPTYLVRYYLSRFIKESAK